ncbi:MAG: hypothetical protein HQ551_01785 [Desulfobacteraceae bacterium]|nr:hypothetical protein [Desulfobacteraceae bacterium]
MKVIFAYILALLLALFNGKLIAGAISGMILTPIAMPFERFAFVSRYLVPILQGIAMGLVGICTAKWVLLWFSIKMGWAMVAIIALAYVLISFHLLKRTEERHFHLSAGLGELLGIFLSGYYFLQMTVQT